MCVNHTCFGQYYPFLIDTMASPYRLNRTFHSKTFRGRPTYHKVLIFSPYVPLKYEALLSYFAHNHKRTI